MTVELDLQIATTSKTLPSEKNFQLWLNATLEHQQPDAELSIRIVDELESHELNNQYRGMNKPTNVLSFPFEAPEGIPTDEIEGLLGDLVICAAVVNREAKEQHKLELHHWAHMTVHGTLHLLGFDHISDEDAEVMENLERKILSTIDIPDPYLSDNEE